MSLSGHSETEVSHRRALKRGSLLGNTFNKIKRASQAAIGANHARRKTRGNTLKKRGLKATASFREEHPDNDIKKISSKSTKIAVKQNNGLYANLTEKLFEKEINEKRFRDISRMACKIQLDIEDEVFLAREEFSEAEFPNSGFREVRMISAVAKKLMGWFGRENKALANVMCTYVDHLCDSFENNKFEEKYSLENVLLMLEEKMCVTPVQMEILNQTKQVLKFVTVSVIIFGLMEMRDRLNLGPKHLTKDLKWDVFIRCSDKVIEVRHERVERTMEEKQNYWELAYMVIVTFSPDMEQFITARMALTSLNVEEEEIDPEFHQELKRKFCNGQLIVC